MADVLAALSALYAPDATSASRRAANEFLDSFQKSREAWDGAVAILDSPGAAGEARTFAAQTVKIKCIYDLSTHPDAAALRGTVLRLFAAFHAERTVFAHLAVGLAALALQTEWADPIADIVALFGPAAESEAARRALAEFLRVLPEEGSRERNRGASARWRDKGPQIVQWVVAGIGSSPSNARILDGFTVLRSWLSDGDLPPASLLPTPLIPLIFSSLTVPELSDAAVDLAVEVVRGTRALSESMDVVQAVYPHLLSLRPLLDQYLAEEDEEALRGMCRIYAEAGEAYLQLVAAHPNDFAALVQAILDCARSGAEVSRITFRFWFELADKIAGPKAGPAEAAAREAFKPTFRALAEGMLRHLRYPPDSEPMSAEERDDFRDFRHDMGDTLKDCALVLGTEEILTIPHRVLAAAEGAGSWQELEAPLFFLRAVGARIPDDESAVLPRVMALLPGISPSHPKLRYAALLVIGRYASWTGKHAEFIPFQLTFVADGFSQGDAECKPAATQAFLFLCESCGSELVPYLPQLHPFYLATLPTLQNEDRMRMAEAISNVLLNVKENLAQWIGEFLLPVAQRLHAIAGEGGTEDDATIRDAADLISQLAVFVKYLKVRPPPGTPHPLAAILSQMWPILSPIMTSMGIHAPVASALARLFVNCVVHIGPDFLPLMPPILSQLVEMFERTGDPAYLWVCKRSIEEFGSAETEAGRSMGELFRAVSVVAFGVISKRGVSDIPDLLEEYFSTVSVFFRRTPAIVPHLNPDFVASLLACTGHCLATEQPESAEMVLGAIKDIYLLLCERDPALAPLLEVFRSGAEGLLSAILNAVLFTAPREVIRDCGDAAKAIADAFPGQGRAWLDGLVRRIPEEGEEKEAFLGKLEAACIEPGSSKMMRNAMQEFASTYRRRHLSKSRSKISISG
ncbi:armadillo-type protein [Hyaloraphidium curvatum]|nr:armadillo-type protein [Hyaloraphidium curvatum]